MKENRDNQYMQPREIHSPMGNGAIPPYGEGILPGVKINNAVNRIVLGIPARAILFTLDSVDRALEKIEEFQKRK